MKPSILDRLIEGNEAVSGRLLDQLAHNEKMAELGHLAVGVIHELNTPLSVIAAAAQLIQREEGLPEHVSELLERIGSEARRLSQMSRSILTYGRLDSGVEGEADINLVLREVLQLLAYEIQKRSVKVNQSLDYGIPILPLDSGRLKQIFTNLIMNALHAMDNGGTLTLKTILSGENVCEIELYDTGHGISEQYISQVFEPYFTTKHAGQGTGLGLFVTREIVQAMRGSITVASSEGHGTCFTLLLPVN